jgi:multiple sugar transport system permease protein
MLASLYLSFTHYDLLTPPQWVGLSNYQFMFSNDPYFWQSVWNTVWIVGIATPIQIVFAIGSAMVLTRIRQGAGVYRTVFFVPTMVPAVAATLGFVFLLNPPVLSTAPSPSCMSPNRPGSRIRSGPSQGSLCWGCGASATP